MSSFRYAQGVALLFAVLTLSAAEAPLEMTVDRALVTIGGATPAGVIVVYTVSLDGSRGVLLQRRVARAVNADDAGEARYLPEHPLPYRTICVAVDVETGRTAIAGPANYPIQIRPFPADRLKHEHDGASGVEDAEIAMAGLLVVRPKTGAWHSSVSEGGGRDRDQRKNGKLTIAFEDARPVYGDTPAPSRLKNKDVIFLIDSARLELFTTEVE